MICPPVYYNPLVIPIGCHKRDVTNADKTAAVFVNSLAVVIPFNPMPLSRPSKFIHSKTAILHM